LLIVKDEGGKSIGTPNEGGVLVTRENTGGEKCGFPEITGKKKKKQDRGH